MSYVCRFCAAPLEQVVVDLGAAPLANSYLEPEALLEPEAHHPLCTFLCTGCLLVQLPAMASAEAIFSDYAYFSSYSSSWLEHARRYTEAQRRRFGLDEGSLVVEVASNDGYLLQYFRDAGVPVLGIEPASNVARVAEQAGIPTINRFLGAEVGAAVVAGELDPSCDSRGDAGHFDSSAAPLLGRAADLVVANNVFAHVPDLRDFTAGLRALLAPGGVLTIEAPHLMRLLDEVQFDTIYHEHFSYYSLLAAQRVLAAHGLVVFDVEEVPTHGGSLRIFCRRDDAPEAETAERLATRPAVDELLRRERRYGLDDPATYRHFAPRVAAVKRQLLSFLIEQADAGRTVVGYGAPAKGNTLLNYCGVRPDLLPFTVDLSPHKQGRFLPGSRIPIRAPEAIAETRPDFVLILPWNLRAEIAEQMSAVRSWGGRFVVAVPRLTVLD